MSWDAPGAVFIPLGVLAERRPAATRWAESSWHVVGVTGTPPELPPWTVLREAEGVTLYLAGRAQLALYPTDTANYRDNLAADPPRLWVVLRPVEATPGLALHAVTADPAEAELYTGVGADLVEALPLPEALRAALEAFVAQHHVERRFEKRRRDRADPEALARRRREEEG
jgi:ABC-type amino acid transport substrate-binding protein